MILTVNEITEDSPWFKILHNLNQVDGDYPHHTRVLESDNWQLIPRVGKRVEAALSETDTGGRVSVKIFSDLELTVLPGMDTSFSNYYEVQAAQKFVDEFNVIATLCIYHHASRLHKAMRKHDFANGFDIAVEHQYIIQGLLGKFLVEVKANHSDQEHPDEGISLTVTTYNNYHDSPHEFYRLIWMEKWQRSIYEWTLGIGAPLQAHRQSNATYDADDKWIPVFKSTVKLCMPYAEAMVSAANCSPDVYTLIRTLTSKRESMLYIGYGIHGHDNLLGSGDLEDEWFP